MLTVSVWSHMVSSYFAVPLMLPQRQGLIVNTTLEWGGEYGGGCLFYYTAKTAINHMTPGMAPDLRPYNIAVVGLSPGWMRTEAVMSGKPPTPSHLPKTWKGLNQRNTSGERCRPRGRSQCDGKDRTHRADTGAGTGVRFYRH